MVSDKYFRILMGGNSFQYGGFMKNTQDVWLQFDGDCNENVQF